MDRPMKFSKITKRAKHGQKVLLNHEDEAEVSVGVWTESGQWLVEGISQPLPQDRFTHFATLSGKAIPLTQEHLDQNPGEQIILVKEWANGATDIHIGRWREDLEALEVDGFEGRTFKAAYFGKYLPTPTLPE